MDCSPPDSSVHGILQEKILEWVAISFSKESSQPSDQTHVSCIAGGFLTDRATREASHIHLDYTTELMGESSLLKKYSYFARGEGSGWEVMVG